MDARASSEPGRTGQFVQSGSERRPKGLVS
jgi:hypothetical protein